MSCFYQLISCCQRIPCRRSFGVREEGPKVHLAPFPKFSIREIINDSWKDFEVSY